VSCPYTPQQNSLAERKHKHIVELALANMYHAGIPLHFWDTIFVSTVFVINRLPSKPNQLLSPFEKLFAQKPNYTFLRTLGCACYPLLRPYNSHKLLPRSDGCVFLGYSNVYKGYLCFQPQTHKIFVSRNVILNENSFPFHNQQLSSISATPLINSNCPFTIIPSSNYNDQNTPTSSTSSTIALATPISSPHHTPPTKHPMVTRQ
jgi:hypothetical protein